MGPSCADVGGIATIGGSGRRVVGVSRAYGSNSPRLEPCRRRGSFDNEAQQSQFPRLESGRHRACQFFCVWGLEVGGDSVGVGGGELGEGLFPVGGGVSLDEAGVSCSFVGGFASVCEALGGAFVFDVADGEPQEFDGCFFAGEMPAVLGDFTQLVV